MTSKEFITWLKGFLDASSDLTVEGVNFIQSKMKEVADPPEGCNCYPLTPKELYPVIDYSQVCPMGGQHDFPEVWYGIYPPPCKKCGYTMPSQTITCSNTGSADCCLNNNSYTINPCVSSATPSPYSGPNGYPESWDGVRYIEFEVPSECLISRTIDVGTDTYKLRVPDSGVKKITPLNTDEKYYGSNIEMIAELAKKCWFDKPKEKDLSIPVGYETYKEKMRDKIEEASKKFGKLTDKEIMGDTQRFFVPRMPTPEEIEEKVMRISKLNPDRSIDEIRDDTYRYYHNIYAR